MPRPWRGASRPIGPALPIERPSFLGTRAAGRLSAGKTGPVHRLVALLPGLGAEGQVSRRFFDDPTVGAEARKLFDDAQRLLERIVGERLLQAQRRLRLLAGRLGGRRHRPVRRRDARARRSPAFHTLRQQWERKGQNRVSCAGRFHRPARQRPGRLPGRVRRHGRHRHRRTGRRSSSGEHDDYQRDHGQGPGRPAGRGLCRSCCTSRPAQIGATAATKQLSSDDLIDEKYRGIRPAPGYPACPDHTEKRILFDLLGGRAGGRHPPDREFRHVAGGAVSGWYFAHPQARYFAVDRITRDQVESYAARKGMTIAEVERWLAPNLGYEPRG